MKIRNYLFGILLLGALFVGGGALSQSEDAGPSIAEMAIALAPDLKTEQDQLRIALILRDQVYRSRMTPSPADVDWHDITQLYADSVVDRQYGHECGGRAILYLAALQSFGIEARYVGLFSAIDDIDPASTFIHATTEVFINGRWIAMDAHYNISLRDERNRRLGWREAQRRLADGKPVRIDRDGMRTNPDVSIEKYLRHYRVSLREATNYLVIGIHRGSDEALPLTPSGEWDGWITYRNGAEFDVLSQAESSVYQSLRFKAANSDKVALQP